MICMNQLNSTNMFRWIASLTVVALSGGLRHRCVNIRKSTFQINRQRCCTERGTDELGLNIL